MRPALSKHTATVNQLEACVAQELLSMGRNRSSSRISSKDLENDEDVRSVVECAVRVEDEVQDDRTLGRNSNTSHRATLSADKEGVLKMCRRLSLDELQTNHAAVLAKTPRTNETSKTPSAATTKLPVRTMETDADSMICAARFWLLFVGILGFRNATAGSVWFALISLPLLAQIVTLVYFTARGQADFHHTGITLCYMVGSTLASWSMRQAEIHLLLGHENGGLEDYARKLGFLKDWRSVSRRRMQEVLCVLVLMLASRWLCFGSVEQRLDTSLLTSIFFSSAGVSCTAVVYAQLHLVAGMDLAIDSFSISFFKEMDVEQALDEWNTVQATLRQVSTKLSYSLVALGGSCGAALLLLAELVFFHPESPVMTQSALQMAFFLGWLFPPVLLFLYAMMRAAAVTEKASRVAPLVNSWTFVDHEDDHSPAWMDLGRQYIVQYMNQSEAGFYLQGVKLNVFQVTKLSYYFAAFIFAVLSKTTQAV